VDTLRVLGVVDVLGDEGRPRAHQSAARVRRLLAALAVREGSTASVDWLADVIWGDRPPANPAGALQTLVSRLRPVLGPGDDIELVTQPSGYRLRARDGRFDARSFERLAREGAELLDRDPQGAARVLDEALGLWTGPAYGGLAEEDFARAEAARLEEMRSVAVEDRVEASLRLGRHHEVAARLAPLVAEEPLRERRQSQLMLARHRAGRSAEALEGYRLFRARLADELGIEPSEQLQRLHTAILRGDPALAWSPAPGTRTGPEGAGNLGSDPPSLFGRDQEVSELARVLRDHAVVTLTGPGGVGKTSLARTVAHRLAGDFPDGVWLVELAALGEATQVPLAVASTLDVPAQEGLAAADAVVAWLAPQRVLLVLDNCEHLAGPVAEVVTKVRGRAPSVTLLVTSQVPLEVPGEQLFAVPPLPPARATADDPAVRLFIARARAQDRGFQVDEASVAVIADLCRKLDGLPLAIELAAARMRGMSPRELSGRLSGRFRLLHGGARTGRARHRTLRALVDWSYGLLGPSERRVFEVLSVFAGGFTLEQAEGLGVALLADDGFDATDVADSVLTLVDRSMVVSRPGSPTVYRLLETLRDYGRERLRERGAGDRAREVHAVQMARLVADTPKHLWTAQHVRDVGTVSGLLDELRSAFAWSAEHDVPTAATIVAGSGLLVEHRMSAEVAHWADTLLAGPLAGGSVTVGDDEVARVLTVAAAGARFRGALAEAGRLATRARRLATEPLTCCYASYLLAEVAFFEGDLARAQAPLADARELSERHGLSSWRRMLAVDELLGAAYAGEDPVATSRRAADLAEAAQAAGESVVAAWAVYVRGEALLETAPADAAPYLEMARDRAEESGDRYLLGVTLLSLASARSRCGPPEESLPLFLGSVRHWHRVGNWTHQWTTLRNVAVLLVRLGRDRAAAMLTGALATRDTTARPTGAEALRMQQLRAGLVARLGEEAYDEAAASGAALTDDELVRLAEAQLTEGRLSDAAGRT